LFYLEILETIKKRMFLFKSEISESLKRGVFYEELLFASFEIYYKILRFVGDTVKCSKTIYQE